jgi:hypothetical protein
MKCRVEGEKKKKASPVRPDENLSGRAENCKLASM